MKKENNYYKELKLILFIDLENIPIFDLSEYNKTETKVYIFVGNNQQKIPINLVMRIQKFGDAIEWIKIAGQGKNTLDFHLAFFLGQLHKCSPKDVEFKILSKDSGFDSLILYINNLGRKCHRITNISKLNELQESIYIE